MSLEAIRTVATAEADAERQLSNAVIEAKKIIAGAEAAGKDEVIKAKEAAEKESLIIYRDAERRGKASSAEAARETEEKCLTIENVAASNMDKAVKIILERVVSG